MYEYEQAHKLSFALHPDGYMYTHMVGRRSKTKINIGRSLANAAKEVRVERVAEHVLRGPYNRRTSF